MGAQNLHPDQAVLFLLMVSLLKPAPKPAQVKSYTLHPTPYTLHSIPYSTHPTPNTPHPSPYTLHITHSILNSQLSTLDPEP
jgi:hypothetical protein